MLSEREFIGPKRFFVAVVFVKGLGAMIGVFDWFTARPNPKLPPARLIIR